MRTDPIGQSQRTSRLHAPAHILNLRLLPLTTLFLRQPLVDFVEILPREHLKARHNPLPREILYRLDVRGLGYLDLEGAFSEAEAEYLGYVCLHLGFEDDIVAGYAEVDVTLSDEGGDVGGGEEDATSV